MEAHHGAKDHDFLRYSTVKLSMRRRLARRRSLCAQLSINRGRRQSTTQFQCLITRCRLPRARRLELLHHRRSGERRRRRAAASYTRAQAA